MKNLVIKSIFALFIIFQFQMVSAQIKGNGQIITQELPVTLFEKVHINFPVILELDANSTYQLTMTSDENILPEIVIKNKGKKLSILQDKWIAPTQMVKVKIGTKGLKYLELGGYGKAKVINLNEENLEVINSVGQVTLAGRVNQLIYVSETGNLDASKLLAKNVNGEIWSHGEAIVNVENILEGEISENGKIIYLEKPKQINLDLGEEGQLISVAENQANSTKLPPVKYINVKLKNNRFSRIQTYVKGPKNKKFSYGMPFNPKQTRNENYPIGTKIYKVNKIGTRKLLVTIAAEYEGKIVNLFD